ncbi:hypothetical protein M728_002430 [Ensifer sp. WSM1721]
MLTKYGFLHMLALQSNVPAYVIAGANAYKGGEAMVPHYFYSAAFRSAIAMQPKGSLNNSSGSRKKIGLMPPADGLKSLKSFAFMSLRSVWCAFAALAATF